MAWDGAGHIMYGIGDGDGNGNAQGAQELIQFLGALGLP